MKPVLAGIVSAAVAGGATWIYLRSITIDDGLEGLVYLPFLSLLMIAITAHAGWRGRSWAWARSAALGAAGATSVFLLALAAHRSDATLARAAIGASLIVAVFPFTGAVIGWGVATWLRRRQ